VSASDKAAKQCMMSRGIFYLLVGSLIGAESLLDSVKQKAIDKCLVKKNDFVVVTTGINEGLEGSTNLLKIIQI
jgi:pyruvate kinase